MPNIEKKTETNIQDWATNRYISISVQRNILLVLVALMSFVVLCCIVLSKHLYESKSIDPYIIEYNKENNSMYVVDNQSKREYTAHKSVKEHFVTNYIKYREGFGAIKMSDAINLVRVFSSINVYKFYSTQVNKNFSEFRREHGPNASVVIKINSITHVNPTIMSVKFTKSIVSSSKKVRDIEGSAKVSFAFLDMKLSKEDIILNPLGFQVKYYDIIEQENVQ